METLGFPLRSEATLQTLTEDVLKSSEIEGKILDRTKVRSSIARRLGIDIGGLVPADRDVEGVVEMMLDATQRYEQELAKVHEVARQERDRTRAETARMEAELLTQARQSANSIVEEYQALADELTFTSAELAQVARNGWEVADVPVALRKAMLAEIDRIVATAA